MEIGIFSRTFVRLALEDVLDAVAVHGLSHLHFNLKSAGIESLPQEIEPSLCGKIRKAFESRGFVMTSISATFNAINPDPRQRQADIQRACQIIEHCKEMGTSIVSLCTGTRDPVDMWRRHPDNQGTDAWRDLLATLQQLLQTAESRGVILGIEPEKSNVVNSATKARQLLDEVQSPNLKIIMDGANLFDAEDVPRMQYVLEEAFELLGPDVVMAHAKDITDDPAKIDQAAGTGCLDWSTYCRLLKKGCPGPVVLHNLRESQVATSVAFLRRHLGM